MNIYLIHATEKMYERFEDWIIRECSSYEEACRIGNEMSYDVMVSCNPIMDQIEEEVHERLLEEGIMVDHADYDDLYNDWINNMIKGNIEYSVYELQKGIDYDAVAGSGMDWTKIRDTYSVDYI